MRGKLKRVGGFSVLFFLVLVVSLGCWFGSGGNWPTKGNTEKQQCLLYPPHPSFLTEQDFYQVIVKRGEPTEPMGRVLGGVIPHHLVAAELINNFWELLVPQNPETIVLVGPNHYRRGERMLTGFSAWQTPGGLLEVEESIVWALLAADLVQQDEAVLKQEHAIGNLAPLIKHFLPRAKIVPLILHHDVSWEEVEQLLAILEPWLDNEKSVLVASVDFSHYLTAKEAVEKDCFSLEVMRNFAYPTFFNLGNDYFDSPASLALLFRYAEKKGLSDFRILGNTNSAEILGADLAETTSYFSLFFELSRGRGFDKSSQ